MLRYQTSPRWVQCVTDDLDSFIQDHATCEKKASSMAMSMVSHYPDKPELVKAMIDLAVEELNHYRDVYKLIAQRGLTLAPDAKDQYINLLRAEIRQGPEAYLLDRLLIASVVEARGHERFGLVAEALEPGPLKRFYQSITSSEQRHYELFIELAELYIPKSKVGSRLDALLDIEAEIVSQLPVHPALH